MMGDVKMARRIMGVQRAFDGAVLQLDLAISGAQRARKDTPVPRRPPPKGGMTLAIPEGETEFNLTINMTRRLREITSSPGRVVCHREHCEHTDSRCSSIGALWGSSPRPEIEHSTISMEALIEERPMMIIMYPDDPKTPVPGYIKMTLHQPHICLLLRED